MKERIYRALNIKLSESRQVFDLLIVQFFIGLANALVNIIAFTLFIYNFQIHYLPDAYLVVAGLLILINIVYQELEHRFSPIKLLKCIIAFAAILLCFLWLGLTYLDKSSFIFMLLTSSVIIYMITGYAFWGLVSLLFNVRESRRVFSIVGAGDMPAKLIGYIAGPLLIPFLGLNNILWLAIVSLVTGFYLFAKFTQKKSWDVIKKRSHKEHDHAIHDSKKHSVISFFSQNKLIFAISLLSILSYNVYVLVDYTFISQVKLRFDNISELAAYIAIFFAFGRLIAMAFKLIFTSRVIERLGIIYSLFITPLALFIFCILFFFIVNKDSSYILLIFGLMAMLTEVLRSTMQEPVFFILFQPLKENLRLKGHLVSKGYMYPISLIVVGLCLLFAFNAGVEVTIHLATKIVIINLCVWVAIIFFVRRSYLNTIHSSIKKGTFASDDIYLVDQRTVDILLEKVNSGNRIEVIYALDLLEKSNYNGLEALLITQLTNERDVEVIRYALDRAESRGILTVGILKKLLQDTNDTIVREKTISLLCKHDPSYLHEISQNISGHEYSIRKIIIIQLLNRHEFTDLFKAGGEMNNLIYSSDPIEREFAIGIIGELKHVQFPDIIASLINDENISVRRAAIATACKLKIESLLPAVIDLLDNPQYKNIVLKSLQNYGDHFFDHKEILEKALASGEHYADLIRLATRMKGKYSTDFLLSRIDHVGTSREMIIHGLWNKGYILVSPAENKKFKDLVQLFLKNAMDKINDYNQVPAFNDAVMIKRSIRNEVRKDLETVLKLCTILFGKKEINRIIELMVIEREDRLYNAMEMLELVLPQRLSKDLNHVFDFVLDPAGGHKKLAVGDVRSLFYKVIFEEPLLYNPWTRAVCVYSSWKNDQQDLLKKMKESFPQEDHFLIKETKAYVLKAIKN